MAMLGSTWNKVFLRRKVPTLWGDYRRSQNKPHGGKECSRCPAPRDGNGSYCAACRAAYKKLYTTLVKA